MKRAPDGWLEVLQEVDRACSLVSRDGKIVEVVTVRNAGSVLSFGILSDLAETMRQIERMIFPHEVEWFDFYLDCEKIVFVTCLETRRN